MPRWPSGYGAGLLLQPFLEEKVLGVQKTKEGPKD